MVAENGGETPQVAEVLSFELARNPGSYVEFYQQYGGPTYIDAWQRTSSQMLLDGRVLHFGQQDRNMHLIVRQIDSARYGNTHRYFHPDDYEGVQERTQLIDRDYIVATYDGHEAVNWEVTQAYMVHYGRLDGFADSYKPERHFHYLEVYNPKQNVQARLSLNLSLDTGTLEYANAVGWLLNAHESRAEQRRVLALEEGVGRLATVQQVA